MTRRSRIALLALAAVLGVAFAGVAEGATYRGAVGPGKTITLTKAGGGAVATIPRGRHTFVITDRSTVHNFVLKRGATVVRRTGISATGTFTWRRVRVVPGRYTFLCTTHAREMRRSFRVA
jgi:plastocyanin